MVADKLETFAAIYREELIKSVTANPSKYSFGLKGVDLVTDRMVAAFKARTYNKDGDAIRATCKRLGLSHTYKAINGYLDS